MSERDVVYILRAGEDNEELRHSLRSVAEHLPHRRVWVVGYKPRWLAPEVGYAPVMQRGPKHVNTWANWMAAAYHPEISSEFYLFNDDFYVTRPIDDVPPVHRGTLDEMITWYGRNRLATHRQRAAVTRQLLARLGCTEPRSYELHTPMLVHRALLAGAARWLGEQRGVAGHDVTKRTFYAGFAHLAGERARDVKVMNAKDGLPESELPFLSTSPASWTGLAGGWVRQRWPQPCAYERVTSGSMLYQPPGRASRAGR